MKTPHRVVKAVSNTHRLVPSTHKVCASPQKKHRSVRHRCLVCIPSRVCVSPCARASLCGCVLGPYESAAQELNETKRQEARTKKKKQTPTERNVDTPTEGLGHAHHEAGAD